MRVVIIISGLRGVFHASLEMSRRLKKCGHEVVICSPVDLAEFYSSNDQELFRLPKMSFSRDSLHESGKQYRSAVSRLKGDVFICDIETPVFILALLSLGKQVLILNHFLPIPLYADIPMPTSRKKPKAKLLGGIQNSIAWVYQRSKFLTRAVLEKIKNGSGDRRSILIDLGHSMGLKRSSFLFSRTLLPGPYLLFRNLPTLHIIPREIDFEHKLHRTEYYVGPMVFVDRQDTLEPSEENRLDQILAKAEKNCKKLVYCALSSNVIVSQNFLMKLIDAFQKDDTIEVVVGLGKKSVVPEQLVIPGNIHFFKWIPGIKLLGKVDCALTMAGFHTIFECIHFKVPMVVLSLRITDHEGFMARIESNNLGYTADLNESSPEELHQKVTAVMKDTKVKGALTAMKEVCDKYEEDRVFENLITQI